MGKEEKAKNPHEGHRQRMRDKFIEHGLSSFHEHEILEFLLFYVHSRANTNEIGHALIDKFGSLRGVFDADYDELIQVKGVGERGAVLLKLIPQCLRAYNESKYHLTKLKTLDQQSEFFIHQLMFETQEVVAIACLNDQMELIRYEEIARGVPNSVMINPQILLQAVLRAKCTTVIMAHNHPKGVAKPSYEDTMVTKCIQNLLRDANIDLVDHIVVAGNKARSILNPLG